MLGWSVPAIVGAGLTHWTLAAAGTPTSVESADSSNILGAVILFAVCIALIVIEFIVPSMGLISVTALVCCGLSLFFASQAGTGVLWIFIVLYAVGIPGAIVGGFKLLQRTSLVLTTSLASKGVDGEQAERLAQLQGREGVTSSPLRPAGTARVDNQTLSVQTHGEFVNRGRPVEVVAVEGNRIYVREKKS